MRRLRSFMTLSTVSYFHSGTPSQRHCQRKPLTDHNRDEYWNDGSALACSSWDFHHLWRRSMANRLSCPTLHELCHSAIRASLADNQGWRNGVFPGEGQGTDRPRQIWLSCLYGSSQGHRRKRDIERFIPGRCRCSEELDSSGLYSGLCVAVSTESLHTADRQSLPYRLWSTTSFHRQCDRYSIWP